MCVRDVFISRRIADKIWEEHGVSADEAVDLLYGDPMIRRARKGRYMDDIGNEDVTLEWEPGPADEPSLCPRDGHPMASQQHTCTLADGRFVVTYEAWVCSECGKVFLDRQQARRYGAIQMLDRLLKERNGLPQGQILFDGKDLFVNLSLARDMAALWRQTASAVER